MNAKNLPLIAASAISLFAATVAQASTIHLICRGGHNGTTTMFFQSYRSGTVPETAVSYAFVPFKGTKSQVKRDGSHLHPGECSWATDVLSSKYNTLVHYIVPSGLTLYTSVQANTDATDKGNIVLYGDSTVDTDTADPNQAYIPRFNGFEMSVDEAAGTILDDNSVFNFYVTIDKFNQLVLDHLADITQFPN